MDCKIIWDGKIIRDITINDNEMIMNKKMKKWHDNRIWKDAKEGKDNHTISRKIRMQEII